LIGINLRMMNLCMEYMFEFVFNNSVYESGI
jgi:hypothetical protein